jgi:formamidopyrimidine-DNA glycosylase
MPRHVCLRCEDVTVEKTAWVRSWSWCPACETYAWFAPARKRS